MTRVAFASTDGYYIDEHFGNARFFQVFDINKKDYDFVETRKTDAYCQGHCEGGFEHLLEALKDCEAVFVLKIGQGAATYMLSHQKRVFEASGVVELILEKLAEENMLG